jgi:HEAT repeat protein
MMADVSSLIAGDAAAFESLLQMLMSPQNEHRAAAEQGFAKLKDHPDACVTQLLRSLRSSPHAECRSLSAVLLRKVLPI